MSALVGPDAPDGTRRSKAKARPANTLRSGPTADDLALDPRDLEIARLVRNALRFPSTREAKLSQLRHAARQILDVLDPNPERVDDDPALDRVALLWLAFGDLLAFERSRAVVVASDAR